MNHEIVFAGFGGQGVMLIGTLLAYAGMEEGKAVSWLPSYGPEMRGGTANCAVCIADETIASPVVAEPTALLAMNSPSFEKFIHTVIPGGCVIINSDLIDVADVRDDVKLYRIPANTEAQNLGSPRVANMVCLGSLLGAQDIVSLETVIGVLPSVIHERYHSLLGVNEQAIRRGYELTHNVR
jgi:2-oxoglutarate ferredoxin oxidoreductase subunit gamma